MYVEGDGHGLLHVGYAAGGGGADLHPGRVQLFEGDVLIRVPVKFPVPVAQQLAVIADLFGRSRLHQFEEAVGGVEMGCGLADVVESAVAGCAQEGSGVPASGIISVYVPAYPLPVTGCEEDFGAAGGVGWVGSAGSDDAADVQDALR